MTRAAVALGGNRGRPRAAFREALAGLEAGTGVAVLAVSGLWVSEPWGLREQPEFLNAAVLLETRLPAGELLARLQDLERRAGREPGVRWGPRPLDLDLLFHGTRVSAGGALELPHPRMAERSFVLEPLAEIAPAWSHPVTGKTPGEMMAELRASGRGTACRRAGDWAVAEAAEWR